MHPARNLWLVTLLAAASENAAETRNRMSAGFCDATYAAHNATTSSSTFDIVTRR